MPTSGGWGLIALLLVAGCGSASAGQPVRTDDARGDVAVSAEQSGTARRLAWVVDRSDTMATSASAAECLVAGAACSVDGMLDVDTLRLRASSLAEALTHALDPAHPGYLGRPGSAALDLAHDTVGAATRASEVLARWLHTGCGSNIDGIAVTSHPPECDDLATDGDQAVRKLEGVLARWPAP